MGTFKGCTFTYDAKDNEKLGDNTEPPQMQQ